MQQKNKVALEENEVNRSANIQKASTQPQSLEWLRNQCTIHSNGCIDWLVEDKLVQEEIWEAITNILRGNSSWDSEIVKEGQLINEEEWDRRAVIISGVAGSGKSSLLSQYYQEIKKTDAGKTEWVIRMNLAEHSSTLSKFESKAIDFLTGLSTLSSTKPAHFLIGC